jgi:hypothetical protein
MNNNDENKELTTNEHNSIQPAVVERVKKDIKGWSNALIIIGIISMIFAGFLSWVWGIILIILGVFSFFILEPAMYIVFGVTIILLGVINSITTSAGWGIYSIFQFVIGLFILKHYFDTKSFYDVVEIKSVKFLIISAGLFVLAAIVAATGFGLIVYDDIQYAQFAGLIIEISGYITILGTAAGLASIFTEKIFKLLPVVSTALCFLLFLAFIALSMLGKMSI